MNSLKNLHNKIEKEAWDIKDAELFNKSFQDVNEKLLESGNEELFNRSEKEREVFSFSKAPDGIKWKMQGSNILLIKQSSLLQL